MSSQHHNGEKQEIDDTTERKRSFSLHGPLNLKTITVINHIKRKVKHKRDDKGSTVESDGAPSQVIDESIPTKKNKSIHRESSTEVSSLRNRSQSYTSPPVLSKRKSSNEHPMDPTIEDDTVFEKDEQNVTINNEINENEDIERAVSSDTNQDINKSKPKQIYATKSLPETNTKKRRQTVRRTGFQLRDEDFTMIFSDLPSDEKLIIAFPCALRKDVYTHGRMFLSVNYVSFYTCFFKWEESLLIPYKDIISITREKSAKLVPNAIKIRTKNQEQYLFVSLIPREKVFLAMFRLWQNILLDQPLDYQKLRTLVYADQQNHDETTADSEDSINLENTTEGPSEYGSYSKSLPITSSQTTERSKQVKTSEPKPITLPSENENENETEIYLPSCTCETHLARTFADRLFTYNVDTLLEYMTGDNTFNKNFHEAQKLTDYIYGEWTVNPETGKRERTVTYKTINQSVLGTNTLTCREKQTLVVEQPHVMYILRAEVYNEGVRYTDAFFVATQYCMTQRDSEHSSLRISAEINYIKSVNGFIKSFIEKNSNAAIEAGVNDQVRRLAEQEIKPSKRKSNRKPLVVSKQIGKKHQNDKSSSNEIVSNSSINSIALHDSTLSTDKYTITGTDIIYHIVILIGVLLLILHIYLCYKFYYIDQTLLTLDTTCFNQCRKTCTTNNSHREF